jgi:hypothetical protein
LSLLTKPSVQNLTVLLDLYPVTCLREKWGDVEGNKEEICLKVAGNRKALPDIFEFVHTNFGICKQNVYIFKNKSSIQKANALTVAGFDQMHRSDEEYGISKTFLFRHEVNLILRNPLDEVKVDFILPVRFDFLANYILVRFVKFERDFHALFKDRDPIQPRQTEREKLFLAQIKKAALDSGLNIEMGDIQQGVKKLWASDFMDSAKLAYKTDDSFDQKKMDDNKGIRKFNPDAYDKIKDTKLHLTAFETSETDDYPPILLTVDPSKGFVSFGRYTERAGDSDYVLHKIIEHNE